MHRLFAGLCVLSLATLASADDTKAAPKTSKAAAEFKTLETEFMGKVGAAKTNEDRAGLFKSYAAKFLKLAEENKTDPAAVEALSYPLRMGAPHDAKAITALSKHHAKGTAIRTWVAMIASRPDADSQKLLKVIIDENPDKKLAARAVKAAIQAVERNVGLARQVKGNEKLRQAVTKGRGEQFVKDLLAQADNSDKLIKGYKKLLAEKFKGVLPDVALGKAAPEVVSEDLNGKPAKLSDLKGKVVVLDVWATWCPPCRGMIPHTRDLVKKMKGKPFVFVSVSADAQKKTLADFMKENEMPWTHWWNGATGGVVEDWEITAYPTIFIIDAKGVLREKIVGADSKKIDSAVEKLVEETEKDAGKK